jgi:branched-chain amino acid transport system permease protein
MNAWALDAFIIGGLLSVAAVGLALHLRLVRFFDLSWALWAMSAGLLGVYVARRSPSVVLAVLMGTLLGATLGALEDGLILRKALTSFIPPDVLERFSFAAALAIYLAIVSTTELLGFRDQEFVQARPWSWHGLSDPQLTTAVSCWSALLICAAIRTTRLGIKIRALLDSPSAYAQLGFSVSLPSAIVGLIAGGLTGLAGACFGLLYLAHYSMGLALMLLAVIPCLLLGLQSSFRTVIAAVLTSAAIAGIRYRLGYTASEYVIYSLILFLLILRPRGLRGHVREV